MKHGSKVRTIESRNLVRNIRLICLCLRNFQTPSVVQHFLGKKAKIYLDKNCKDYRLHAAALGEALSNLLKCLHVHMFICQLVDLLKQENWSVMPPPHALGGCCDAGAPPPPPPMCKYYHVFESVCCPVCVLVKCKGHYSPHGVPVWPIRLHICFTLACNFFIEWYDRLFHPCTWCSYLTDVTAFFTLAVTFRFGRLLHVIWSAYKIAFSTTVSSEFESNS